MRSGTEMEDADDTWAGTRGSRFGILFRAFA